MKVTFLLAQYIWLPTQSYSLVVHLSVAKIFIRFYVFVKYYKIVSVVIDFNSIYLDIFIIYFKQYKEIIK